MKFYKATGVLGKALIVLMVMANAAICSAYNLPGRYANTRKTGNDGAICMVSGLEKQFNVTTTITDWSIQLGAPLLSSIVLADVAGDDHLEIIATTFGTWPYGGGQLFVKNINGSNLPGWPLRADSPLVSSVAVGDVDNDGDKEIAAGSWTRMYLLNHDGTDCEGWPITADVCSAPSLADLDNSGDVEIIYPSGNMLYVRHHDGTLFEGFPVTARDEIGSPAIGDIDNDGQLEIVAGTLSGPVGGNPYEIYAWELSGAVMPGFPVPTSGVVKAAPALGDVNKDGFLEIVVPAYHFTNLDYIYCINHLGQNLDGWPIRASYCRLSSVALADIDNNHNLEIFIGGMTDSPRYVEVLYGFNHHGGNLVGWPVYLEHEGGVGNINSSPVIAEVDGEQASPEIFVKTYGYVFGLNADGSFIEGFPYAINDDQNSGTYSPSPAVGDVDYDGDADFIFGSCSGRLHYLDWAGPYDAERSDWPMYKHDQWSLSRHGAGGGTGINAENRLPSGFRLSQNYPNPFNASTVIQFELSLPSHVKITIYDILGRQISTVLDECRDAGNNRVIWNARDVSSGVYFYKIQAGVFSESRQMILLK